jgi:hypothetical protein
MGPLLIGLVLLLLAWLLPWPYPLEPILLIVGVVLVVYGLYLLFAAGAGGGWRWRR